MRQKLPESAGYPLVVNDIGRVIGPGEEFDCPLPVPGCVSLEPAEDAGDGGGEDGKSAAKGRADGKGARP